MCPSIAWDSMSPVRAIQPMDWNQFKFYFVEQLGEMRKSGHWCLAQNSEGARWIYRRIPDAKTPKRTLLRIGELRLYNVHEDCLYWERRGEQVVERRFCREQHPFPSILPMTGS